MADVVVVARARAKAGKEKDLEKALRTLVAPTRKEPGCVKYVLHRGTDDRGIFAAIEEWRSRADVDKHLQTAHVQGLFQRLPELVEGAPELLILEPLSD